MRGYTVEKLKCGTLDLLSNISDSPTVVQLLGVNGGGGHAITIVGRWIFDGNLKRGIPLSKESLDWCCSTDTKRVPFKEVKVAIRLHLSAMLKELLASKKRKREQF